MNFLSKILSVPNVMRLNYDYHVTVFQAMFNDMQSTVLQYSIFRIKDTFFGILKSSRLKFVVNLKFDWQVPFRFVINNEDNGDKGEMQGYFNAEWRLLTWNIFLYEL